MSYIQISIFSQNGTRREDCWRDYLSFSIENAETLWEGWESDPSEEPAKMKKDAARFNRIYEQAQQAKGAVEKTKLKKVPVKPKCIDGRRFNKGRPKKGTV